MRFFVRGRREAPPKAEYPFVVLEDDAWDDYGFKTLFHPRIHISKTEVIDLENVRILKLGQKGGKTPIERAFDKLDDSYCSLGLELAYYEKLMASPSPGVVEDYLMGLRDAAANQAIRERFEGETGFRTSLLRDGSAARALEDAPAVLQGEDGGDGELSFTFHTRFGANEFATTFRYCEVDEVPGRINAIIGYNGTGKTHLLANLAWVARSELRLRHRHNMIDKYGRLSPKDLRFGSVVAISYSALDTFELPHQSSEDSQFGYTYCGLRRYGDEGTAGGLKAPEEIAEDLARALERIDTPDRRRSLHDALQPLREEPSVSRAEYKLDFLSADGTWREEFASLSTGHKMSVNIVVQLVGYLQHNSLVLLDEPESHVHPPLLAALMRGIGTALEAHKSYAVVATHSPVVLQEIAGCYAHVLRRHGSRNSVEEPSIETFGENVGLLTRHVFNLDNRHSDYEGILLDLASRLSLEEIEELFEHGLSSQARSLVMQAQRD